MDLLLIEEVHLVRCDYAILVEVNHLEPVLNWAKSRFVLFIEHEPYEVFVAHFAFLSGLKFSRYLGKDTIHSFSRESVTFIARKVFFIDEEVVVCVQLPKSAVKHIEVLVGKVLTYFVDIFLWAYLVNCLVKVRVLKVSKCDMAIIISIKAVKNAHDNCIGVPLLELRCLL